MTISGAIFHSPLFLQRPFFGGRARRQLQRRFLKGEDLSGRPAALPAVKLEKVHVGLPVEGCKVRQGRRLLLLLLQVSQQGASPDLADDFLHSLVQAGLGNTVSCNGNGG